MPSLLEPAWAGFCAVIGGDGGGVHPAHPAGLPPPRVPGRVVFEHVVARVGRTTVGMERVATPGCSGLHHPAAAGRVVRIDAAETLGGRATALVDERLR
jgi:hypothetical protein